MKVFVLALMLLVVTSGLIGWGSWYVHRVCDKLTTILNDIEAIEMHDAKAYAIYHKNFDKVWQVNKKWFHILLGREVTDKIDDTFTSMGVRYLGDDDIGFAWEREMLIRYIKRVVKEEEVSVDGIL